MIVNIMNVAARWHINPLEIFCVALPDTGPDGIKLIVVKPLYPDDGCLAQSRRYRLDFDANLGAS
jgi:hypothetical protein